MRSLCIKWILLCVSILILFVGCYEIETVVQPPIALTNSVVSPVITLSLGEVDSTNAIPNFGIQLPIGWTLPDTVPFSGDLSGIFVYDSIISEYLCSDSAVYPISGCMPGYYWWVGYAVDTVFSLPEGSLAIEPIIQTNDMMGAFIIEYRVGDNLLYPSYGEGGGSIPGFLRLGQSISIFMTPDLSPISGDVYISTIGTVGASGTSSDPLSTLFEATNRIITDSLSPSTIHIADGIYSDSTTGEHFPVTLNSFVSIDGTSAEAVILGGNTSHRRLNLMNSSDISINNVTIQNSSYVGGIFCENSSVIIKNCIIRDNAYGVKAYSSNVGIRNCELIGNSTGVYSSGSQLYLSSSSITNSGKGINGILNSIIVIDSSTIENNYSDGLDLWHANATINQTTIANNSSTYYYGGGGIFCDMEAEVEITNSIIWGNSPDQIVGRTNNFGDYISISSNYSDIQGGQEGMNMNCAGEVNWNAGSINLNPQFCDFYLRDFTLSESSPCLLASESGGYIGYYEEPGCEYPVNYPPEFNPIPNQVLQEDHTIIVSFNCMDVNSDSIQISMDVDTSLGDFLLTQNSLTYTPFENWFGSFPVTLYATDGAFWDTSGFTITVQPVNDSPLPPTITYPVYGDTIFVDSPNDSLLTLSWHPGLDVDSDNLEYIVQNRVIYPIMFPASPQMTTTDTSVSVNIFGHNLNTTIFGFQCTVFAHDGLVSSPFDTTFFYINRTWLGVEDVALLPAKYALNQNYPNPFNPSTKIDYELPQRSDVQITIYNILGKKMTTLVSETQEAGYKSVVWDASNVASGMYFYQIISEDFIQTKKMVLLK